METTCEESWPHLRRELEKIKVGTFTGPAGSFRQRTEITAAQRLILGKLKLAEPPRIQELTPAYGTLLLASRVSRPDCL